MLTLPFAVRYDELDLRTAIPVTTYLRYFQEAAALDAAGMNYGWEVLQQRHLAWVITHMQLEVLEPSAPKQTVRVTTWHAHSDKILNRREFEIHGEKGELLARGSSWWVLMDTQKRRISRTPQELIDLNAAEPRLVMAEEDFKRPLPETAPAAVLPITTRLEDLDINGHVNNTRYACWAIENAPADVRETKRLKKLLISFKNECRHGEKIEVQLHPLSDGSFGHSLLRASDGKEAARVYTFWG